MCSSDLIPFPPNRYDALLQTAYQRGWKAVNETEKDGWIKSTREQDVDIFSKNEPGSSVNSCKGIGIIDHPPELVAEIFGDLSLTPQWCVTAVRCAPLCVR